VTEASVREKLARHYAAVKQPGEELNLQPSDASTHNNAGLHKKQLIQIAAVFK